MGTFCPGDPGAAPQTRSSTETFLFHLAVADLLLVFILPFAVAESSFVGWVLGNFLCKTVISLHKINFLQQPAPGLHRRGTAYPPSSTPSISYRHRRLLSIHITCATIWLAGCFALPEILAKVSEPCLQRTCHTAPSPRRNCRNQCLVHLLAFLYHIGGFLLPASAGDGLVLRRGGTGCARPSGALSGRRLSGWPSW